ncbi:hypothetical protein GCM10010392_20970 [Streptomyces clavifer]|nr:hypothetical protein GCM10010392_20970 [Streptomyces clavifer]
MIVGRGSQAICGGGDVSRPVTEDLAGLSLRAGPEGKPCRAGHLPGHTVAAAPQIGQGLMSMPYIANGSPRSRTGSEVTRAGGGETGYVGGTGRRRRRRSNTHSSPELKKFHGP